MSDPHANLGADLRLLLNLQSQNDRFGGSDLRIAVRPQTQNTDLQTLQDAENLQQALLMRFLTRQGELSKLGHPDYGCRLYTLIGELNTPVNRNRAKLFVLESLGAEPRVEQVISVDVTAGARDRIDIRVLLRAIGNDNPLNFVFPFFLGGLR
jgi:phage baseplate assembly protein W